MTEYYRLRDILLLLGFLGPFLAIWIGLAWRRRRLPRMIRGGYRFPEHGPRLSRDLGKPKGWK